MALWGRIERVLKWRKSGRADERGRAPDWFEDDGGKQAPPMGVTGMERERESAAGWPAALKCARDRVIAERVRAESH